MKDLSNLLKTPLYRILFNFPIGVIAFVILNYVFNNIISMQLPIIVGHTHSCQNIDNCTAVTHALCNINMYCGTRTPIYSNSSPLGDMYWLIYITLAILIGEIVSFIGEIPVNALFEYNPITTKSCEIINKCTYIIKGLDCPVELITPKCDMDLNNLKLKDKQIFYSDFHDYEGTLSEIHFSMSRMLAGFGFEMYLATYLSFCNYCNSLSALVIFSLILIFVVFFALIYIFTKLTKYKLITLIFVILLIIGLPSSLFHPKYSYSMLFFSVFLFSYIASIYYRAHANKLLAASRR